MFFVLLSILPLYLGGSIGNYIPLLSFIICTCDVVDLMFCLGLTILVFILALGVNYSGFEYGKALPEVDFEKLEQFAEKHEMSTSIAKRIFDYSYKFNDKELEKMYIVKKKYGCGSVFHYIRDDYNKTLISFGHTKLQAKTTTQDKPQLTAKVALSGTTTGVALSGTTDEKLIMEIMNENFDKVKQNVTMWNGMISAFKYYTFDDTNSTDMYTKRMIEKLKKIIGTYNKVIEEQEILKEIDKIEVIKLNGNGEVEVIMKEEIVNEPSKDEPVEDAPTIQ